ncbi:MAG: hypothetical protein SCJ97_09470 [Bacillota bacterium]|nr:hypothetical protein [Bacillota bacterium]
MKIMQVRINTENAYKFLAFILLLIFTLPAILVGSEAIEKSVYAYRQNIVSIESLGFDKFENAPVMNLLGKNFDEIKQVLGEPAEQGYSSWLGPHHYILYQYEEGFIQFCSPQPIENKIAVSIILGPGQEVLGAKVGMRFPEIISILGAPDYGPAIGIDNLYYMEYFRGEIKDQTPEVFISFVAVSINSPTDHVFIKWEAFKYEDTKTFQAAR